MKFPFVAYVDLVSYLLPLGAGLYRSPYLKKDGLMVFIYVLLGFLAEVATFLMAIKGIKNYWFINGYNVIEYLLLIMIVAYWLPSHTQKRMLHVCATLFVIFWVIAKLSFEPFDHSPVYTRTLSGTILIGASTLALVTLMKSGSMLLQRDMRFWISAGILISFAGDVTLYLFSRQISSLAPSVAATIWGIKWWIAILVNILYTCGMLCRART